MNVDQKSGCCGHPNSQRIRVRPVLPINPTVKNGVSLLFMGSGTVELAGSVSGNRYTVSENRRKFLAEIEDLENLLERTEIIRSP
jgi:hypothetical protein